MCNIQPQNSKEFHHKERVAALASADRLREMREEDKINNSEEGENQLQQK